MHPDLTLHNDIAARMFQAIEGGRTHAFLLHGPSGIGKAKLAAIIAGRVMGCAPEDLRRHADVTYLAPERDEKTGDVKAIRQEDADAVVSALQRAAVGNAGKVCIVERADLLHERAQNVLLKVVEEPRGKTLFFCTAENVGQVLPTLRSRMAVLACNGKAPRRDDDAERAVDAAVTALLVGPMSARLCAAASVAKGDDAASRDTLCAIAVRAAETLHSVFVEKCGTMTLEERRRSTATLLLLNEAPTALRDYANPALVFERVVLAMS